MLKSYLYSPEPDQGGGGGLMGGLADPPASPASDIDVPPSGGVPAQEPPTSLLSDDGKFNPNWYQGNAELEPFGKQLDKFTSPAALAKSYATLEKQRTVPSEGAEQAAVDAFRAANSIPKTHEEYDIKLPENLPEGVIVDDASMAQYKETFHGLNLTPYQAQKLTESHMEITGKMLSNLQGEQHTAQQEAASALQQEWGNGYQAKLESAQHAFDGLCAKAGINPDSVTFTGDPAFAKIMAAVSGMTSESTPVGAGGYSAPSGGKQEAREIMTNSNHPDHSAFYNAQDPRHNEVQDRVARMNR